MKQRPFIENLYNGAMVRRSLMALFALWLCTVRFLAEPPPDSTLPAGVRDALERISAQSLRGHASFLASDLLEGRNTPSRGLAIAAEYIAAQFRRAGLKPLSSTQSYFQTARWKLRKVDLSSARAELGAGDRTLRLTGQEMTVLHVEGLEVEGPLYKLRWENIDRLKDAEEGALSPYVVMLQALSPAELRSLPPEERKTRLRRIGDLRQLVPRLKPKAVVGWNEATRGDPDEAQQLVDPENEGQRALRRFNPTAAILHSPELKEFWEQLPEGPTEATLRLKLPVGSEEPVELHNVAGILPGSDPVMKNSVVLVSAHYDHIGLGEPDSQGDRIYNGANDDASGVASMLEIAAAMAASSQRPKRTVVFLALFGEEKGLLGAKYYVRHPIFPVRDTVANLNLEQLGRTDSQQGVHRARLSPTGYSYSELTDVLEQAGALTGVEIYHDVRYSEAFFSRSDNLAFAEAGIPSTTVCVAFDFPEYHSPGDHWEKMDYENLAKVSQTLLAAVWLLADQPVAPSWKTDRYRRQSGPASPREQNPRPSSSSSK
ncbi:MAG: M20/M25/M40 family metallo-hydrolase [Bryobacteraceae bacterium]|nr:M20/M25/M40 family metallo-hydrolase [Bryobacteraceae bacterium]MDW8378307.1 M20/M25/M40 family metallo-hydrolase [Bryobacterales bacterium]